MKICNLWSTANNQWKSGNWTWADCQLIILPDIPGCIEWEEPAIDWENSSWDWEDCSPVIIPLQSVGVDATTLIQPWMDEPWNPYKAAEEQAKRIRLVELICKVSGVKSNIKRTSKKYKMTIENVKISINEKNIDLSIQN